MERTFSKFLLFISKPPCAVQVAWDGLLYNLSLCDVKIDIFGGSISVQAFWMFVFYSQVSFGFQIVKAMKNKLIKSLDLICLSISMWFPSFKNFRFLWISYINILAHIHTLINSFTFNIFTQNCSVFILSTSALLFYIPNIS